MTPASTLRADLHAHTLASDGTDDVPATLAAALRAGLSLLAITDHDRIDAARMAVEIASDLGLPLRVVIGQEVTTRSGHLLALDLERRVAPLRSLGDTIAAVHDQGGLAIPAHPFAPWPSGAGARILRRLAEGDPGCRPDGLETLNRTPFGRASARVARLADQLALGGIGSSDSHAARLVACVTTEWEGDGADPWGSFRQALAERRTRPQGGAIPAAALAEVGLRKARYLVSDARDELAGAAGALCGRPPRGRPLGWPGSQARPPELDRAALVVRARELGLPTP